ncbi:MAG: Ig-like domain-containing protein [Flavisolibacter sp.]
MVTVFTPSKSFINFLNSKWLFLLLFSSIAFSCKKSIETPGVVGVCPVVTATDPSNGATNVPTNKKITATFNEVMDEATINGSTFVLTQGASQIAGTVSYNGSTASFVPSGLLLPNTVYTGKITTGAKDAARNTMASNYVWTFTTAAAPLVILTDPADGASDVALNKVVSATFNRVMNPATLTAATFLIMQGGTKIPGVVGYSGSTATFTPTSPFSNNAVYTATITTDARDSSGNPLAANFSWSFSTLSPSAPPPQLGAVSQFGVFGGSAGITNEGLNTIINNGGIGTTGASTLITGFHDGMTGDVYTETPLNVGNSTGGIFTAPPAPGTASSFAKAQQGLADANNLYNSISPASKPGGIDPGAGELGGLTLAPGIYKSASGTFKITNGDLILDGKGDPNAVWIFQTAAGLTVGVAGPAGARSVKTINGAQAKNVFWYVGSAATINGAGGGVMTGTIVASAGITFSTSGNAVQTVLNGRALSLNASVTMVNTTINVQ